jgi:hypothetical protein
MGLYTQRCARGPNIFAAQSDEAEWAGAVHERLEGGGVLRLLQRGEFLYVAVEGQRQ